MALRYARFGWPVFPCGPFKKSPLTVHGFKDATTDPETVRCWWLRHPNANVAVRTGAPGPNVLDVDTKGGAPGLQLLDTARRSGLLSGAQALVLTPSGGLHLYFAGTDERGGALRPGRALELKAAGGYVLVPPSHVIDEKHGTDGHYELLECRETVRVLDWSGIRNLFEQTRSRLSVSPVNPRKTSAMVRWLERQEIGNRNAALYWAACRAVEEGHSVAPLIEAAMTAGLPQWEVERTAASASARMQGQR